VFAEERPVIGVGGKPSSSNIPAGVGGSNIGHRHRSMCHLTEISHKKIPVGKHMSKLEPKVEF